MYLFHNGTKIKHAPMPLLKWMAGKNGFVAPVQVQFLFSHMPIIFHLFRTLISQNRYGFLENCGVSFMIVFVLQASNCLLCCHFSHHTSRAVLGMSVISKRACNVKAIPDFESFGKGLTVQTEVHKL